MLYWSWLLECQKLLTTIVTRNIARYLKTSTTYVIYNTRIYLPIIRHKLVVLDISLVVFFLLSVCLLYLAKRRMIPGHHLLSKSVFHILSLDLLSSSLRYTWHKIYFWRARFLISIHKTCTCQGRPNCIRFLCLRRSFSTCRWRCIVVSCLFPGNTSCSSEICPRGVQTECYRCAMDQIAAVAVYLGNLFG